MEKSDIGMDDPQGIMRFPMRDSFKLLGVGGWGDGIGWEAQGCVWAAFRDDM
jgi:hypothetical protein